jgi:hypothetical protein
MRAATPVAILTSGTGMRLGRANGEQEEMSDGRVSGQIAPRWLEHPDGGSGVRDVL